MSLRAIFRTTPLLLTAALLAQPAQAMPEPRDRPAGERDASAREPRLRLQAEVVSEIPQDKVQITLAADVEGTDQAEVSQRLTKIVNDTLAAARTKAGQAVQVQSGGFRLWPSTDRDGRITAWRGRGEVLLESGDLPAAAKLAAESGGSMGIADVAFSLSREKRQAEEKRLLGEAAQAFRQRAQEAAQAFGFEDYRIRSLDLSGSGSVFAKHQPRMMRASMAATSDAVPPLEFEAGVATVTVTVQGEVALGTSGK